MENKQPPSQTLIEALELALPFVVAVYREHGRDYLPNAGDALERIQAALAAQEASPVLAFQAWAERYTKDRGKPFTQDEYFLAQAAFVSAHPGQGPTSALMAVAEASPQPDLARERKAFDAGEGAARRGTQWLFDSHIFTAEEREKAFAAYLAACRQDQVG